MEEVDFWSKRSTIIIAFLFSPLIGLLLLIRKNSKKIDVETNKMKGNVSNEISQEKPKEFYNECLKNGIEKIKTETERQKAILIAKVLGYPNIEKIEETYEEGKSLVTLEKMEEREREIEEIRRQEQEEFYNLNMYSEMFGRNKEVAILSDKMEEILERIESIESTREAIWNGALLTQQAERDWAFSGGIASGLAGSAAGVATALDMQAKNAVIREQNASRMSTYVSSTADADMRLMKEQSSLQEEVERIKEKRNKAKIKLVSDSLCDEIFKNLKFTGTKVSFSSTGAFRVNTTVNCKRFWIFDNVLAVIDGAVECSLVKNGEIFGSAMLVFPLGGISETPCTVKGICLSGENKANADETYEIKFTPYKLWEIER